MKLFKYSPVIACMALIVTSTSCENSDTDFPDYEGGLTVYYARQYPVRTLVMGDDTYDTSSDKAHKCMIFSTVGGSYSGRDITVNVAVDPSLTEHLYFENGNPVKAMPENYYKLASTTARYTYNSGLMGGVEVEFTDAFFNDPAALVNTYVIPLVITDQKGADRINRGEPVVEGQVPPRCNAEAWKVLPKDYVLYCVKYINKYDAEYAVRGKDIISENGTTTTVKRHTAHVETDELRSVDTRSLSTAVYPVSTVITDAAGDKHVVACDLLLNFDADDKCTITTDTPGITASGSGKFVVNGEKKAWGNKDRNAQYLDYTIDYGTRTVTTADTLVVKSRNVSSETFSPKYNN